MKILYIALKFDYGIPKRGFSFEHYNFYDSLIKMDDGRHEVIYFPFDEILLEVGQEEMNKKLLMVVKEEKPDLCFFFLFTDEIYSETIKKITSSGVLTYNWFADDHWRFPIFSRFYAPNFSWISTTDSQAVEKYKKIGCLNIIHTQWACNHFMYNPKFSTGDPNKIVEELNKVNIKVDCYGGGWPNGRVSQEKMIEIFSKSKINLNPTKSSGGIDMNSLGKILLSKKQGKYKINLPWQWPNYIKSFLGRRREQIKGRTFEIPGCGGFLISGLADNIFDYYKPDKEMVFYKDQRELVDKVRYYLNHDNERVTIAEAGYKRTVQEHTYEVRFREIFKMMNR